MEGRTRRFWLVLGIIVVAAAGVRVAYVLTVTRDDTHFYDATYYELQARSIGQDGLFFQDPWAVFREHLPEHREPAADHAPLTALSLVPAALIDDPDDSRLAMRFTMVIAGLGAVVLIGLLGRSVGGDAVGLVAAGVAAADPNLWMNDGLIMSESLTVLAVSSVLLVAYRVLRGASLRWVVALGVLCGILVLVRAELGMFTLLVAVPAVWVGTRDHARRGIGRAVLCAGLAALVVLPWAAFNVSRFEKPALISTNSGLALVGANCPSVYWGSHIGAAEVPCAVDARGDPSVADSKNQTRAFNFIGDNIDRLPLVVAARIGRTWALFHVDQTARFDVNEGRPVWASYLGVVALYLLAALAVVGGVVLRRRKVPIWPLVTCFVIVILPLLLVSGLPRYRAAAEPALVVLAAAGAVTVFTGAIRRLRGEEADDVGVGRGVLEHEEVPALVDVERGAGDA